jgi:hypothetical protein
LTVSLSESFDAGLESLVRSQEAHEDDRSAVCRGFRARRLHQIKRDTDAASKACAAGRDAEAKSLVAASQRRHGYPADL